MRRAPTNTIMPMTEPTISTTRYLGETRSHPVSAGGTAGRAVAAGTTASGATDAAASVAPWTSPDIAGCSLPSSRISGMCVLFLLGFGVVGRERAERLGDETA